MRLSINERHELFWRWHDYIDSVPVRIVSWVDVILDKDNIPQPGNIIYTQIRGRDGQSKTFRFTRPKYKEFMERLRSSKAYSWLTQQEDD